MNRLLSAALAAAFLAVVMPPAADAQTARQARQEVEASMLVTGHVDIDRSGQVTALEIDRRDKLPPYVLDMIEGRAAALRFEPIVVDGEPALARAKMSVRLVMSPAGNGQMNLRIASAHFGEQGSKDNTDVVRSDTIKPPRYPAEIARINGQGTVYLLVKVGRDGSTQDVHAEQVNLTALGSARQMERIRTELARAAVNHARREWTWTPPTTGELLDRDFWVVRIPVDFRLGREMPAYGSWVGYHPGDFKPSGWGRPVAPGFRPDALAAGGEAVAETSRFRLLNSFEG